MTKTENKPAQKTNKGFTLWFTGLPCSGKSTLAQLVAKELQRRGRGVEVLDGDVVRTHLTKGLGFSKEDRDENIRRIGFVCHLLSKHGVVAIAAAISPYRAIRDEVRATIENFIEVYVNTPLEACIQRDVKGMYKKALAGEMKGFTGVDDPYEAPPNPELVIETDKETPEVSAARILCLLEQRGLVDVDHTAAYTPEEAEKIRQRLEQLGYIES
jgi:adenylylsulfate kinase